MSAQDQDVNMNFGFALRGDRQVERGLDSIVEKFARTGSFADAAALSVEKLGRVFEVGLPVALGAVAVGRFAESIYEVTEQEEKLRANLDKWSDVSASDSLKDINSSADKLSKTIDDLNQKDGLIHAILYGNQTEEAATDALNKVKGVLGGKNASDINFESSQITKELSGDTAGARIDKINRDADEKIAELRKEGRRTEIITTMASGRGSHRRGAMATEEARELPNANLDAIAAENHLRDQQIKKAYSESPDFKSGSKRDEEQRKMADLEIEKGHARTEEQRAKNFEAFVRGNETDLKTRVEHHNSALNKYLEDQEKLGELTKKRGELSSDIKFDRPVTSHGGLLGGGTNAYFGAPGGYNPHEKELKENSDAITKLTNEMAVLIEKFNLNPTETHHSTTTL